MPRTYGHQPTSTEQASTPPTGPAGASSTATIQYEDLQCTIALGRGVIIDRAPEHAKVSVSMLTAGNLGLDLRYPGLIKFAYQVQYEITGYDPADATLTLRLTHDWRPGQKDDPNREQPSEQP